MGQAVEVTCPDCKKIFVVNPHMLGSGMNFHCPYLRQVFPRKRQPQNPQITWSAATVTIAPWRFSFPAHYHEDEANL